MEHLQSVLPESGGWLFRRPLEEHLDGLSVQWRGLPQQTPIWFSVAVTGGRKNLRHKWDPQKPLSPDACWCGVRSLGGTSSWSDLDGLRVVKDGIHQQCDRRPERCPALLLPAPSSPLPVCHLCLDQNWCQWVGRVERTEAGAELCESNEVRSLWVHPTPLQLAWRPAMATLLPSPAESCSHNCVWACDSINRVHTLPVSGRGGTLVPALSSQCDSSCHWQLHRHWLPGLQGIAGPWAISARHCSLCGKTPAAWLPVPRPPFPCSCLNLGVKPAGSICNSGRPPLPLCPP